MKTTLGTLFDHNDWANQKVLGLASKVSDADLDRPFEMGLGSLRKTLGHVWAAEDIWLRRWQKEPNLKFVEPEAGIAVAELVRRYRDTADRRAKFFGQIGEAGFREKLTYTNIQGRTFTFPYGDMALHVANHGIHHRAQALNMLRHAGQQAPGADYIFMCCERPTIAHTPEARAKLTSFGMTIADNLRDPPHFDVDTIRAYYAFSDWAMNLVLTAASKLPDAKLDQSFEMGMGTLRRTLLHIRDAEDWWRRTWTAREAVKFERLPATTSIAELQKLFDETANWRNGYLSGMSANDLQQTAAIAPTDGLNLRFRIGESMLQLCSHGTHHRAQAINMLRHLGQQPPEADYILWIRNQTGQG